MRGFRFGLGANVGGSAAGSSIRPVFRAERKTASDCDADGEVLRHRAAGRRAPSVETTERPSVSRRVFGTREASAKQQCLNSKAGRWLGGFICRLDAQRSARRGGERAFGHAAAESVAAVRLQLESDDSLRQRGADACRRRLCRVADGAGTVHGRVNWSDVKAGDGRTMSGARLLDLRSDCPLPAVLPAVSCSTSRFLTRSDPPSPLVFPTNAGLLGFSSESGNGFEARRPPHVEPFIDSLDGTQRLRPREHATRTRGTGIGLHPSFSSTLASAHRSHDGLRLETVGDPQEVISFRWPLTTGGLVLGQAPAVPRPAPDVRLGRGDREARGTAQRGRALAGRAAPGREPAGRGPTARRCGLRRRAAAPADGGHRRAAADVPGGGPAAGYRGPPERRGRPPAAHLEAATSEGGSVGRELPVGALFASMGSVGIHGPGAGGRTHNGLRRGHRRVGRRGDGPATTARERRAAGFSNAAGGRRRHPRPTPSTWPPSTYPAVRWQCSPASGTTDDTQGGDRTRRTDGG